MHPMIAALALHHPKHTATYYLGKMPGNVHTIFANKGQDLFVVAVIALLLILGSSVFGKKKAA